MKKIDIADILENTTEGNRNKKVGFVAIIGRPNVGKSTFLNTLIGEKISITSSVPQTTRNKILAIHNTEALQIIFLDTPGIHKSSKKFNEEINSGALSAIKDSELLLYFVDGSRKTGEEEEYIQSLLDTVSIPMIKVITKSDLPQKIKIVPSENTLTISSEREEGFSELIEKISKHLPVGPMLYPEDFYTKQGLFFRISEIVREKLFLHTQEELPHSAFVAVEEVKEEIKMYRISSYIYVETESQKYIVIGKAGALITKIGKEARIDLESILGKKVFITVRVKVRKNWRKDENLYKQILK